MAAAPPPGPTAWIALSSDTDPLVEAHIEHAGDRVVGETHRGDDWREALAWARARTDRVFLRFDNAEITFWAGAGPPPETHGRPVQPLLERPAARWCGRPPAPPSSRTPMATGPCCSSALPTRPCGRVRGPSWFSRRIDAAWSSGPWSPATLRCRPRHGTTQPLVARGSRP
jgi:hypothetical protein